MEHVQTLVVGAGVTGLAFADRLNAHAQAATGSPLGPDRLQVLEAAGEVGGYCKTVHQDGFVWDYSGHFFHFKHPEIERELVDRMADQRIRKVSKVSKIRFADGFVDFPFQKNIHQLPREDFLACLTDLYDSFRAQQARAVAGLSGAGGQAPPPPANFREMLVAKFGRGIAERFLIPYNEKLYATDLGRLDVDAMGRFFPYADLDSVMTQFRQADNASYNATFTYPEGGAIEYVRAIQRGVPEACVRLRQHVSAIDLQARVAHVEDDAGARDVAFDYLVSTTPLDRLVRMTGLAERGAVDPSVFSYNKVLVFNLGFDRKGPRGVHWIYYPQRDVAFYRVGFYDNIFDTDRLSIYVEVGYPADAVVDDAEVALARERVLADLARVGVIDGHRLVSEHSIVLDPAYVHITRESLRAVEHLKGVLAVRGVYSAGRYGSWTYCSIEDNMVEARALADLFRDAGLLGA